MQGIVKTEKSSANNKTRKKTSFKKQSGRGYKRDAKKSTRKQENLHKLLPTVLILVNDRVRVKGKHNGIVKYIGRLEGSAKQPDIYVGVHLDEPVTKSSGVFKGRQYFDCPFGYGIMIPYNQVQKINRVKKLAPVMDTRNSLERNEPYSIKRWKSATDVSEIDLDLPQPETSYVTKQKRMVKEKSATDPREKKFKVPELIELSPPVRRGQDRELSGMLNMWSSRNDNPNVLLRDVCQPNPYPSSSALQQSFAMICDTYSSSDSGFGEAYPLGNDRGGTIEEKHRRYITDDSTYLSQYTPQENASSVSLHRLMRNTQRTRSLPRNIGAYDDDENDSTEQFIQARRTFPKTPRETFDAEGYYISKGAVKIINPTSRSPDISPKKSPTLPKSLAGSQFMDPIVGSDYKAVYLPRAAHTVINVEATRRSKKPRGRSKKSKRDVYSNSLQRNETKRYPKTNRMVRAKSVGEGLGQMRRRPENVLKSDLMEWRIKFGDIHANGMLTGLQKLQEAFAKGMNLKDTYGYPTNNGRYIKVAK